MVEDNTSSILAALVVLRDAVDGICDIVEQATASLEESRRRLEPYKKVSVSDPGSIRLLLERLPPKNAAALVAALIAVAELVPPAALSNADEQAEKIKGDMMRMRRIRDNLNTALDGVV